MITRHLIINVLLSASIIILGTLWVYNREVTFFNKSIIFFYIYICVCMYIYTHTHTHLDT